MSDILEHHGIKGQKWGVRRYQNKDGSYTQSGRERRNYQNNHNKLFNGDGEGVSVSIARSRYTPDSNSNEYYDFNRFRMNGG